MLATSSSIRNSSTSFNSTAIGNSRNSWNHFWKRRNPNPGSAENKFREEHYRRIAHANKHYAGDIPGWKTDRGYTYIVYGRPDWIDRHFSDTGSIRGVDVSGTIAHDSEVWHYRHIESLGNTRSIKFVDTCARGRFETLMMWEKM